MGKSWNVRLCTVDDNLVCGTLDELTGFQNPHGKIVLRRYLWVGMVCSKVDDFAYLGMHVTTVIIGGKVEF